MAESAISARHLPDFIETASDVASETFAQRIRSLMILGYTSVVAFTTEQAHMTQELPQPAQAIAESMAHPALGYAGAWLAAIAIQRGWFNRSGPLAVAATGAIDFAVEEGQDLLLHASGNEHWWAQAQWYESSKDLGFAVGGMGLFYFQAKLRKRRLRLSRRHKMHAAPGCEV